jgi:hypothetical protein
MTVKEKTNKLYQRWSNPTFERDAAKARRPSILR